MGVAGQDVLRLLRDHKGLNVDFGYAVLQGTVVEYLGSPWLVQGAGLEGNVGVAHVHSHRIGAGLRETEIERKVKRSDNDVVDKMIEHVGGALLKVGPVRWAGPRTPLSKWQK